MLTRPEVVIFLRERLFEFELDEYRPLGDPTRFLGALAALFSRCKDEDVEPGGVPGLRGRRWPRAADAARRPATMPRGRRGRGAARSGPAAQGELARAYARYQELLARGRLRSTSATR